MAYGNGHGSAADHEALENAMRLGATEERLRELDRRLADIRVAAFSDPSFVEAARIAAWHELGRVTVGRVLTEEGDIDLRVPEGWPEGVDQEDAIERLLTERMGWRVD